ncbi:MAG: PCRF domain-containing protein, partial [Acidithiobacillus sp.]
MSLSPRLQAQLEQLAERAEELQQALASPEVLQDNARFQAFSRELGDIQPVLELLRAHEDQRRRWEEAQEILHEERDPELRALA